MHDFLDTTIFEMKSDVDKNGHLSSNSESAFLESIRTGSHEMSGMLWKRSIGGFIKNWTKRHFKYDGKCVTYKDDQGTVKGVVQIDHSSPATAVPISLAGGRDFAFTVACYKVLSGGGHDNSKKE